MRKRVNAQRRKYQRTKGKNDLRDHREYLASKAEYAATIRYTSWKYCTLTSTTNPWSGIYSIMTSRDKRAAPQTTLKQKDGILTTNLQGTIHHILRIFTPEDNQEDTELQKKTRALSQEIDTDKEFTLQEVKNVMSMGKGARGRRHTK